LLTYLILNIDNNSSQVQGQTCAVKIQRGQVTEDMCHSILIKDQQECLNEPLTPCWPWVVEATSFPQTNTNTHLCYWKRVHRTCMQIQKHILYWMYWGDNPHYKLTFTSNL